jgi:hypothetical protein
MGTSPEAMWMNGSERPLVQVAYEDDAGSRCRFSRSREIVVSEEKPGATVGE